MKKFGDSVIRKITNFEKSFTKSTDKLILLEGWQWPVF